MILYIDKKKTNIPDEELEAALLWKMHRHRVYGKYHWSESIVRKNFPSNIKKEAIATAERLVKKGLLVHIKHGETHYHINLKMIEEIENIIKKFYFNEFKQFKSYT